MEKILTPTFIPDNPLFCKNLNLEDEQHVKSINDIHKFVIFFTETCLLRCDNQSTKKISRSEQQCVKKCIRDNLEAFI